MFYYFTIFVVGVFYSIGSVGFILDDKTTKITRAMIIVLITFIVGMFTKFFL